MGKVEIVFGTACIVIIGVLFIMKVMMKKNKMKNLQRISNAQEREQKLEEYIRNPAFVSNGDKRVGRKQIPYEVEYCENLERELCKNEKPCIQLTVSHGVTVKKYLIAIDKEVKVGRAKKNDIVLKDEDISNYHLVFMKKEDGIYLKDLKSTNGTNLVRGRNQIQVTENAVKLRSDDSLILGEYTIKITM